MLLTCVSYFFFAIIIITIECFLYRYIISLSLYFVEYHTCSIFLFPPHFFFTLKYVTWLIKIIQMIILCYLTNGTIKNWSRIFMHIWRTISNGLSGWTQKVACPVLLVLGRADIYLSSIYFFLLLQYGSRCSKLLCSCVFHYSRISRLSKLQKRIDLCYAIKETNNTMSCW